MVEQLGGIDIVVNNAGIGAQGDVTGANPDDEWHRVWDVNVVGMARVTRAALPHLRASQHAAIVNTSSIVAHVGLPSRALYSATKGAVPLHRASRPTTCARASAVNKGATSGDCRYPMGGQNCSRTPRTRTRSAPRWRQDSRTAGSSPPDEIGMRSPIWRVRDPV